jgi:endonuclease/exonuclease/phosphatase family metal-dependent hydrolase
MPVPLRLATFNLENLDDKPGQQPTLAGRIALMRPQLLRLRADVLCLQEVNGQEVAGQPRQLLALDQVLAGTPYAAYHRVATMTATPPVQVFDVRNLVILSRFPISHSQQVHNDLVPAPSYRMVTANPPQAAAQAVGWERPILYARITLSATRTLHVVNVHFKSKLPTDVPGQKLNQFTWRSAEGWAEGSFLSSMKRVGQAVETRRLVDSIFDGEAHAWIVVGGDFNADVDEVALQALRGDVENTSNAGLSPRVLVPCERSIPESARYSLFHQGRGVMLDHLLASRAVLAHYTGTEIHNEILHDESVAFATDILYPESDHAPVVASFELPDN